MTLHDTTETAKKGLLVIGIGFGIFMFITISMRIGGFIKAILFPAKIAPPNEAYGKLQQLAFPKSTVSGQFTYSLNTLNGELPQDFPDRITIFPMIISQPNLLNLDNTKNKVASLGFSDQSGNPLSEISLGGPNYEWREPEGFQRQIIYNIINQNFTMTSNYLTSLAVFNTQSLGDQTSAIATVQNFLSSISSLPADVDLTLTQNANPDIDYATTPQLFSIVNGQLSQTTSLSNTQIIRVDLYQKEVDYTLTAGQNQSDTHFQDLQMKLPILYPHPPHSTMNFLIASGPNQPDVVSAIFNHQTVNLTPDTQATYPIKTVQDAFTELKNGNAYIAAYTGTNNQIVINKVYLAYYLGETEQQYLMPIIVFEGQNGFFAYVSALTNSVIE